MYNYMNSVVLPSENNAQYKTNVDISTLPVNKIFYLYSEIYLILDYNAVAFYVDFNQFRNQLNGYNGTLAQWLASVGNITMQTIQEIPTVAFKYARFSDAIHAGYKMTPAKIGYQIPLNYPTDSLPDIKITRPNMNTDMSLIHSKCLVSVNGFLHRTDTNGEIAYITDAAISMRKAKANYVGLISFLDIGDVEKIQITQDMISKDTSDIELTLANKAIISLTGDYSNKTIMMSFGGYLIYPSENTFHKLNDNTYVLNTGSLNLIQKYFESNDYIDLTSLGLTVDNELPDTINVEELLTDTVITNWLTLSQSFIIVIDTPTMNFQKRYIDTSKIPNTFYTYKKPINPLITGYGRIAEYWPVRGDQQWQLSTINYNKNNYIFNHNVGDSLGNVNPATLSWNAADPYSSYMLEMSTS